MRIGIFVGSTGATTTLEEQIQEVVDVENQGFDSFWSAQILGVDALTLLALAGQRTGRIEMGTGVVPIYPHHPLALAQQALTAQAASGGRLALGLGVAHKPTVEGRMGLEFDRPALRMREFLTIVRSLVDTGSVDFSGEAYRVNAELQMPGATPFPILIAALAPRMLRTAGELADGTVTWMTGPKTLATHIVPRINEAAEEAGRPKPRVVAAVPMAVTDDVDAGRRRASKTFQRYGEVPSYQRMLVIEGVSGPGDMVVLGNEAEVERQIRAYADAGTTDFVANVMPTGSDRQASAVRTHALLKSLMGKVR